MIQLPSAFQRVNLTPPPGISCWPNRLAWPHSRRGLTSDAVRSAGARSSVGRQLRSVTILRLQWHGGVFLLLQQRPKHSREMVIMSKASTPLCPPPPPAFTRYCYYQYCMVYGIQTGGRRVGRILLNRRAIVLHRVGNAGGRGE